MSASDPLLEIHWYANVELAVPSSSEIVDTEAVSTSSTWAVPEIDSAASTPAGAWVPADTVVIAQRTAMLVACRAGGGG